MEYIDLNNAEITVTTQHIMDGNEYRDHNIQMSEYSDMDEFLCACSDLFPEEQNPEYRYTKWEHIPDNLINSEWICPNFFEIRDALEISGENDWDFLMSWSEHFGYDITSDDPYMIILHYMDMYDVNIMESEECLEDIDILEDDMTYEILSDELYDISAFQYESKEDNYYS